MSTRLGIHLFVLLLSLAAANSLSAGERLRKIDPAKPFHIEFGRGSGRFGLATVQIESDGTVKVCRESKKVQGKWERTKLKLTEESLGQIVAAVKDSGVLKLEQMQIDRGMADGTQWVFWAVQGETEASVYCSNMFPAPIVRFADTLDQILAENGLVNADWMGVPFAESYDHQKELWKSIKR